MLTPRYEPNEPRMIPYNLKRERLHHAKNWFDLRLAQKKRIGILQTINNAIILYDSMQADFPVKVVKINLDGTEAEILHEKRELEQRKPLRIQLQENPAHVKVMRNVV